MPMSSYVANLRSFVGNDVLHLPTASVLCEDDQGRLLLVQQRESGRWSVPGGAIEPGEVPAEAAAREAFEETGLVLAITGLRCALGGPEFRTVYANGDVLSYVALVYDAAVTGGEEHPDGDEIAELGWFTRAELAELPQEQFVQLLLRDGIIA